MRIVLLLLLLSTTLSAAEDFFVEGQRAEAYANANDYDQAADIYEEILKQNSGGIPDWQRSILLYNLGSVKLKQQQYETAYNTFYQIPKNAISSPWILRDLEQNEGLTALYEALNITQSSETPDLLSQVQFSIHHFKVAQALDCLIERLEMDGAPLVPCGLPTLAIPLQEAHRLLDQLKQNLMQELAKSDKNAILMLIEGLNQLEKLLEQEKNSKEYLTYFHYQAATLTPLWNNIHLKSNDLKKKYEDLLTNLEQGHTAQSLDTLKSLIDSLKTISGSYSLDSIILDYQLLLYTEPLFIHPMRTLLAAQKKLIAENKQNHPSLEKADQYLEKALSYNKKDQPILARFYLAAALNSIEESRENTDGKGPIGILEMALLRARNSLQLCHLYDIIPVDEHDSEMDAILENAQQTVLDAVPLFIGAVLKEEQKNFKQTDQKKRCQKTPWNQAIPLFDKGAREALGANTLLSYQPPHAEAALEEQTLTIKYWKRTLSLLKNPPSPESSQSSQEEENPRPIPEAPSNADDVLRLLQEMQQQDQKEKWQAPAEFKSW